MTWGFDIDWIPLSRPSCDRELATEEDVDWSSDRNRKSVQVAASKSNAGFKSDELNRAKMPEGIQGVLESTAKSALNPGFIPAEMLAEIAEAESCGLPEKSSPNMTTTTSSAR